MCKPNRADDLCKAFKTDLEHLRNRARRYFVAILTEVRAVAGVACLRRQCHQPLGRRNRLQTSPLFSRGSECASQDRRSCRLRGARLANGLLPDLEFECSWCLISVRRRHRSCQPAQYSARTAVYSRCQCFGFGEMDTFRQWIADRQNRQQMARQGLDDRDFKRKPRVAYIRSSPRLSSSKAAVRPTSPRRQSQQGRTCPCFIERFNADPFRSQRIERNIDAVELADSPSRNPASG